MGNMNFWSTFFDSFSKCLISAGERLVSQTFPIFSKVAEKGRNFPQNGVKTFPDCFTIFYKLVSFLCEVFKYSNFRCIFAIFTLQIMTGERLCPWLWRFSSYQWGRQPQTRDGKIPLFPLQIRPWLLHKLHPNFPQFQNFCTVQYS